MSTYGDMVGGFLELTGEMCVLLADVDGHEYIWTHGWKIIGVDWENCVYCRQMSGCHPKSFAVFSFLFFSLSLGPITWRYTASGVLGWGGKD